MKLKIQTLLNQLNHGLVEREEIIRTALLTALAGEHIVLIGPPGTGKSMIARRIAKCLAHDDDNGDDYFEYLLTKFSTPEEIFGPLSIAALKVDRFQRKTDGYLPTVKVAFLDEIFKASSSILNSLLTILNERKFHNGSVPQKIPLQALIAASNELPTDQEELSALYDRFLVRSFVDYVSESNLPLLFEKDVASPALTKLSTDDLNSIQSSAKAVTIPNQIAEAVQLIWGLHKETFKEDRRERLSDRRLKKVIKLLCVSAATNGRSEVDLSDVLLLKNCLWNHQENAVKVYHLIFETLSKFSSLVPQNADALNVTIESVKAGEKSGGVVKGFQGSGTAQDPLLIQTVEDLMELSRPDVGVKGYHFLQTADIDCAALSSWMDMPFKGHYDGGGHTIKGIDLFDSLSSLFSIIQSKSIITNLNLEHLQLASTAHGSHITHCVSTDDLIEDSVAKCIITSCKSDVNLIKGTATDCTITACQTGKAVVHTIADHCVIKDCLAIWNGAYLSELSSGIVGTLSNDGHIERCYSSATDLKGYSSSGPFSGIARECRASTINSCAVGKLQSNDRDVEFSNRIVRTSDSSSKLENNASTDINGGGDDISGKDGKTVPSALFKQRFFEHTLGWDFDAVWQWDDKEDRPALRSVGLGSTSHTLLGANMTDLLLQQIKSNIWL